MVLHISAPSFAASGYTACHFPLPPLQLHLLHHLHHHPLHPPLLPLHENLKVKSALFKLQISIVHYKSVQF